VVESEPPVGTPLLHLSHDAVVEATRRRACSATSPPSALRILSHREARVPMRSARRAKA